MDQEWSWPDDDYGGESPETADTADLSGPDEPLAADGLGGYGEPTGEPADGSPDEPGPDDGPAGDGGQYLEDDPMAGFDGDAGADGDDEALSPADPAAAGPEPGDEPGTDGPGTDGPVETIVGADPDIVADADWSPAAFPEQLDVTPPEPVDGYPWTDPSAVAAPDSVAADPAAADPTAAPQGAPPAQDLLDYAGSDGGADPWAALVGSDDPAASSLGRWWAPGT